MRSADYRAWLSAQGFAVNTVSTRLSDAKRVESFYGDLDEAFDKDGAASLLSALAYSGADRAEKKPNPSLIPIEGNLYDSLASYRSAVTAYGRYRAASQAQPTPTPDHLAIDRADIVAAVGRCEAAGSVEAYLATLAGLGKPHSYWLLHEGRRYPSKAIVNDAYRGKGGDPASLIGGSQSKAMLERLGFVVIDWPAFEKARVAFLSRMESFGTFADRAGAYWDVERRYKNEVIAEVRSLVTGASEDGEVGRAVIRALTLGRQGLPLSWRTLGEVEKADPALRDRFYGAVARLARAQQGEAAIAEAARELEALRAAGIAGLRRGEVLAIPISVWGTLHPDEATWFKVSRIETMGQRLFSRRLFARDRFEPADLDEYLQLVRALFTLFDRELGWRPADLFDVQSFVWVALDDQWEAEEVKEDAAVLARFDSNPAFRVAREGWTADQLAAFKKIALLVHSAGLDWWHVNIAHSPVRFGRKSAKRKAAEGVAGYLTLRPTPRIWFNDPQVGINFGIEHVLFDKQGAARFSELIEQHADAIAAWKPPVPLRPGLWPDKVEDEQASRENSTLEEGMAPAPTNLILHGPPGTGKTFATAIEAVALCDGRPPEDPLFAPERRGELMDVYRALVRRGRIAFVTFHQSYGYEDFIEGLRPVTGPDEGAEEGGTGSAGSGGFSLRARDGVFKQIARLAGENRGRALTPEPVRLDRTQKVFKMSLGRSWAAEDDRIYQDAIRDGYVVLGYGGEVDWSDARFDKFAAIKERWREDDPNAGGNDPNIAQIYALRANMQVGSLVVVSDGNRQFRAVGQVTGPYQYAPGQGGDYNHRRAVRWLWHGESLPREQIYAKVFSQVSVYQLNGGLIDWDALEQIVAGGGDAGGTTGVPEPYVLVIDEINRGNISKIFGELITLLEPDKRLGAVNELKVRLPYSGDLFGVPANLHVVGTMNTADRSIALIDKALRRRFTFTEMMPDSDLPALADVGEAAGVDLGRLLRAINERIEWLLDREHQVGHAWFLDCDGRDGLDAIMRRKVIPLIAEYFFEDWGKVSDVLGGREDNPFLERIELRPPPGYAGEEPRYRWRVRDAFAADAYARISG